MYNTNRRHGIVFLAILSTFLAQTISAPAQGSLINYQGRLNDGSAPAQGIYDLRFTVYDAATNGSVVAGPLTQSGTVIRDGLFTAQLDFGASTFNGDGRWLQIAVSTNGAGDWTVLLPLQALTAAPYSIMAASASNLLGNVSVAQLPPAAVTNGAPSVSLSGAFSGNGAGLAALDASKISSGALADARLSPNVPLLNASQNTFTGSLRAAGGILARGGAPGPFGISNNGYAFLGNGGDNDSGMFSSADGQIEFYNNAAEAMRIVNGYVGIGVRNPSAPLEVFGANGFPQLAVTVPTNSPYGSFLSLDASAAPGGKNYLVFSTANVAGQGRGKLVVQNHTDGVEVLCLTSNGNVGIGTLSPQSKLQVNGNIQMGNGGASYAASSQENLRIIRGTVDQNGVVRHGLGFTVVSNSVGNWTIQLQQPFPESPTVVVSGAAGLVSSWNNVSGGQFTVYTATSSGASANWWFSFMVLGPP